MTDGILCACFSTIKMRKFSTIFNRLQNSVLECFNSFFVNFFFSVADSIRPTVQCATRLNVSIDRRTGENWG